MKKLTLLFACICFAFQMQAQVSKTVTVATAGTLSSTLTVNLATITNLTIIGSLDARDFKIIRDEMPALETLDISKVNIMAFTGVMGTQNGTTFIPVYQANTIPQLAFYNQNISETRPVLKSIIFPESLTSFGFESFHGCTGLTGELTIPSSVTSIGDYAFYNCTGISSLKLSEAVITIGTHAFNYCSGITGNQTIPASVKNIGAYAFSNCTRITSITADAPKPIKLPYPAFGSIKILYVPIGSKTVYSVENYWKNFPNIYEKAATSLETKHNESMFLYPNPTSDYFYINGFEGLANITITDLNGNIVYKELNYDKKPISVINLQQGVYIVQIITANEAIIRKVMKK